MKIDRRRFAQTASLLLAAGPAIAAGAGPRRFQYGVASGDPLADRVILWSHVGGYDTPVEAGYELSLTPDFSRVVSRGRIGTDANHDYTLKVDVGGLAPGQTYYYRFAVDGEHSPIGRTNTLPGPETRAVRIAVVSCSNYPAGFFNVYRAIGHRNDIDAVVHLGDYIYEYEEGGYASERAAEFGRLSDPPGELLTLQDYRRRHAQYKGDPDLQYVHSRQPFIPIWDDHELANDAWSGGAQNHSDNEGAWASRRDDALRAYYEWLPIRPPEGRPLAAAYRSFRFGNIATLAMIESRLCGRSEPASYESDLRMQQAWFSVNRRGHGTPLPGPAGADSVSVPQAFDIRGENPEPVRDYERLKAWADAGTLPDGFIYQPDKQDFDARVLRASDRRLLSDEQFAWLDETLETSRSDDVRWQIIGNQTLVSPLRAPNLEREFTEAHKARLPGWLRSRLKLSEFEMQANLDSWDGYPRAREELLRICAQSARSVVLTGDTHNAWAAPLHDRSGQPASYELATPSVSSPGLAEGLLADPAQLEALFRASNGHFDYMDLAGRGYLTVTLSRERADAEFSFVNRIDQREFTLAARHRLSVGRTTRRR